MLFESVLTTQHSLQQTDGDLNGDSSILGNAAGMADFVLELTDCEAFVTMYDRDDKGWLSVDDLIVAFTPHTMSSIRSLSDESSLNFTGEVAFGGDTSESKIAALIAHIVTSESIFLTKI